MLIAIATIYFQQNQITAEHYNGLIISIGGSGLVLIFMNYLLQRTVRKRYAKILYIQPMAMLWAVVVLVIFSKLLLQVVFVSLPHGENLSL